MSPWMCHHSQHTACVMNAISHDTAYAFFPRATFEERRSLVCTTSAERRDIALTKYSARGWHVLTRLSRRERQNSRSSLHAGKRSMQDCRTWRLRLSSPPLPPTELVGVVAASTTLWRSMVDLRTGGEWNFEYQTVPRMVFLLPWKNKVKAVRMRTVRRDKKSLLAAAPGGGRYNKSCAVF